MLDLVLSLLVLAAFALIAGGVILFRRGHRKQAGLVPQSSIGTKKGTHTSSTGHVNQNFLPTSRPGAISA